MWGQSRSIKAAIRAAIYFAISRCLQPLFRRLQPVSAAYGHESVYLAIRKASFHRPWTGSVKIEPGFFQVFKKPGKKPVKTRKKTRLKPGKNLLENVESTQKVIFMSTLTYTLTCFWIRNVTWKFPRQSQDFSIGEIAKTCWAFAKLHVIDDAADFWSGWCKRALLTQRAQRGISMPRARQKLPRDP